MRLTLKREHHLVTEKYGHLDLGVIIELDTATDEAHDGDYPALANRLADATLNPGLERLDRSLDAPEEDEFIRAWVKAKGNTDA